MSTKSKEKEPAVTADMINPSLGLRTKGTAAPHRDYGLPLGQASVVRTAPAMPPVGAPRAPAVGDAGDGVQTWPPAPGTVLKVLISDCVDNRYNARRRYYESVIRERAASIAAEGQRVPAAASVHPTEPGKYILIDGGYRKRALQHLGREHIEVKIEEVKGNKDLYRLSAMYNKERDNGTVLDKALAWKLLLDDKVVADQNELAVIEGMEKAMVSKILSILNLPEIALEALQDSPKDIGPRIGYELYRLSQVASLEVLMGTIEKVANDEITASEIDQLRQRVSTPASRKPREVSRMYRIKNEGAQVGYLKDWDNGKVAFEIKLTDPRKRQELIEELKARFGLEAPEAEEQAS